MDYGPYVASFFIAFLAYPAALYAFVWISIWINRNAKPEQKAIYKAAAKLVPSLVLIILAYFGGGEAAGATLFCIFFSLTAASSMSVKCGVCPVTFKAAMFFLCHMMLLKLCHFRWFLTLFVGLSTLFMSFSYLFFVKETKNRKKCLSSTSSQSDETSTDLASSFSDIKNIAMLAFSQPKEVLKQNPELLSESLLLASLTIAVECLFAVPVAMLFSPYFPNNANILTFLGLTFLILFSKFQDTVTTAIGPDMLEKVGGQRRFLDLIFFQVALLLVMGSLRDVMPSEE